MQSTRSPKDTSVKLFTSEAVGAPSLTQAAGALIDVLSACLVNGFGMQQVSSFTVTAGVGQITVPAATGWERMCVIDVAGCADTSYNGEYKLTDVSADGLRVSFPIDAPDGTVLGAAITVKLASAGWLLRFADPATSKAVYMPGTPQWAGHCLRVEDVAGTHANVRAYESMTGVDAGFGVFPGAAQVATATWVKALGTARPARWLITADERLILVAPAAGYASNVNQTSVLMRWFGRFDALNATDMHAVSISVQSGVGGVNSSALGAGCAPSSISSVQTGVYVARSIDGAEMALTGFTSLLYPYVADSGADSVCGVATGLGIGDLVFGHKYLRHTSSSYPRAKFPGVLHLMHSSMPAGYDGVAVDIGGRLHRLFSGAATSAGTLGGARLCAVDIEGPWA